jgi:hypothetical protein
VRAGIGFELGGAFTKKEIFEAKYQSVKRNINQRMQKNQSVKRNIFVTNKYASMQNTAQIHTNTYIYVIYACEYMHQHSHIQLFGKRPVEQVKAPLEVDNVARTDVAMHPSRPMRHTYSEKKVLYHIRTRKKTKVFVTR